MTHAQKESSDASLCYGHPPARPDTKCGHSLYIRSVEKLPSFLHSLISKVDWSPRDLGKAVSMNQERTHGRKPWTSLTNSSSTTGLWVRQRSRGKLLDADVVNQKKLVEHQGESTGLSHGACFLLVLPLPRQMFPIPSPSLPAQTRILTICQVKIRNSPWYSLILSQKMSGRETRRWRVPKGMKCALLQMESTQIKELGPGRREMFQEAHHQWGLH
ncbi:hypothetical protein BKA80DRAFT_275038 [Phyllosticta citrichinensis]